MTMKQSSMIGRTLSVALLVVCTVAGENPYRSAAELATDMFRSRKLSGVVAFTCWKQGNTDLVRLLTSLDPSISVAVVDPKREPNILKLVLGNQGQLRSPTRVGVLADMACPGTVRLLHLASRLRHLSHRHFWIIMENGKLAESNSSLSDAMSDRMSSDELASIADVPFQPMGPEGKGHSPRVGNEVAIEVKPPPPRPARILTSRPELLDDIGHRTLSDLMVFVDSDVVWVQTDSSGLLTDAFVLPPGATLVMALQVFRSSMARDLQVYQVAVAPLAGQRDARWVWTLSYHERKDIVEARRDMEGATMRATTIIQTPDRYTTIDDLDTKDVDILPKVQFNLVKHTAEILNFSMVIHFLDNYGWELPNGSFDGMFGELKSYSIDLGATGILLRHDRLAYCEICAELYQLRTAMIFRQPPRSSVDNIFLLPFTTTLWLCVGCLLALIITFLALQTGLFAPNNGTESQLGENNMDHFSLSDVVMFVLGAICQQGFPRMPENFSARISVIALFFTALFLFTSYSASIVAILQAPSHAIKTLSDVISSRMEIGMLNQAYNKVWFREAQDPLIRSLYKKKIAPKGDKVVMSHVEGIRRVRNGFFAFQVEKNQGYGVISQTFLEEEKCDLSEFELFNLPILAIPTPKLSPYREMISQKLRWQREVGLLKREHLRWEAQRPNCGGSGNTFVRVGLQEFKPALMAFQYGVLLALIIFVLEKVYHKRSVACGVCRVMAGKRQRSEKASPASASTDSQTSKTQ